MAKDRKGQKKSKNGKKAARAASGTASAADTLKPSDSELRFQHVVRNMVVAREEARKTRD
jgi:hypothetical protein